MSSDKQDIIYNELLVLYFSWRISDNERINVWFSKTKGKFGCLALGEVFLFICHHIFVWKIINRKGNWHDLTGWKGAGSCCTPEGRRNRVGKYAASQGARKRAACVSTKEPWISSSPLAEHACASVVGRWRTSCKCSEMGLREMLINTEIKHTPTLCMYSSAVGFICWVQSLLFIPTYGWSPSRETNKKTSPCHHGIFACHSLHFGK